MDVGTLEHWLWDAACEISGPLDAPKLTDPILPLVFVRRLSEVFDDETAAGNCVADDARLLEDLTAATLRLTELRGEVV